MSANDLCFVTMPCWYYDKKELKNTPSALDGIDYDTEMRYRKEGTVRNDLERVQRVDDSYNCRC